MGMRRGAVKTPGGKLVAVTVQTDQSGLPVACRLDGDFFIDGDGAPLLLDDLEPHVAGMRPGGVCRQD